MRRRRMRAGRLWLARVQLPFWRGSSAGISDSSRALLGMDSRGRLSPHELIWRSALRWAAMFVSGEKPGVVMESPFPQRAVYEVGILRLRMPIRFAHRHAALRMTELLMGWRQ